MSELRKKVFWGVESSVGLPSLEDDEGGDDCDDDDDDDAIPPCTLILRKPPSLQPQYMNRPVPDMH